MRQQLRLHPDSHSVAVKGIDVEIARPRAGSLELSYIAVSYTHLTLPTNREV